MLVFNTLFPIKIDTEIEFLIKIAKKWILGSPHSTIREEDLSQYTGKEEWEHIAGSETFSFITGNTESYISAGVRYSIQDSQLTWLTDIIGTKKDNTFMVSIQVFCETSNPAIKIPIPKKPYIVKQILENIGGGADGCLEVTNQPHYLSNLDIKLASDLMKGELDLQLPIVYVSVGGNDQPFVNEEKLALWFAGMAHVVVEPNREFSFRLMQEVFHKNAYGGAVGIYWPDGAGKKVLLPSISKFDSLHLEREVSNSLRNGLNTLRTPRFCTWWNLKEIIARRKIEQLRKEGSTQVESYIEAFDDELAAKEEELSKANQEIQRLNAELRAIDYSCDSVSGDPLLVKGSGKEFYPNEYNGILLSTLNNLRMQVSPNSRRQHILEDVLAANSASAEIEKKEIR